MSRDEDHCITCGDVGVEMTVVGFVPCGAQCRDGGGVDERVEIDLVEPVAVGDRLLVHAGVAIARLEAGPAVAGEAQS